MAGPRVLGPRVLRQLTRPSSSPCRSLHMTGAATAPRLATQDKTLLAQFLKPAQVTSMPAPSDSRHFNTSRSLKAVNDNSTIDFAFLPRFELPPLPHEALNSTFRVPILPSAGQYPVGSHGAMLDFDAPRSTEPTISTIALDTTHHSSPSAMSDLHDGGEHHEPDFHDVADMLAGVRDAAQMVALGVEREVDGEARRAKGMLKTVWTGLVDDLFGVQKTAVGA